jgi:hypothetical protein
VFDLWLLNQQQTTLLQNYNPQPRKLSQSNLIISNNNHANDKENNSKLQMINLLSAGLSQLVIDYPSSNFMPSLNRSQEYFIFTPVKTNRTTFGNEGRPINLKANYFSIKIENCYIYQYSVDLSPEKYPKCLNL